MAALANHVISKEVEIASSDSIALLDTHVYINNPYWLRSGWLPLVACRYTMRVSWETKKEWLSYKLLFSLSTPFLSSTPVFHNKFFFCHRKWGGGWSPCLPVSTVYYISYVVDIFLHHKFVIQSFNFFLKPHKWCYLFRKGW